MSPKIIIHPQFVGEDLQYLRIENNEFGEEGNQIVRNLRNGKALTLLEYYKARHVVRPSYIIGALSVAFEERFNTDHEATKLVKKIAYSGCKPLKKCSIANLYNSRNVLCKGIRIDFV